MASTGATHDTGTVIGTASVSVNMSAAGTFTGATPVNCQINGTDLELANSGDGTKIIKVFLREASGDGVYRRDMKWQLIQWMSHYSNFISQLHRCR